MSQRMNLFKDYVRTKQKKSVSLKGFSLKELPKFKLSFQLVAVLGIGVALVLGILSTHLKYKKQVKKLEGQIHTAQQELQQLMRETEMRTPAAKGKGSKKLIQRRITGLDGSWASVLWKFAAFTGNQIMIKDMTLTKEANLKSIKMNGNAKTIKALKYWLSRLIDNIPGAEFVVEQQTKNDGMEYPIYFLVTTKIP